MNLSIFVNTAHILLWISEIKICIILIQQELNLKNPYSRITDIYIPGHI